MWTRVLAAVDRVQGWLVRRFPPRPWPKVPKGAPLQRHEKVWAVVVLALPFLIVGLPLAFLSLGLEVSEPLRQALGALLVFSGMLHGIWTILYPYELREETASVPLFPVGLGWLTGTLFIGLGASHLPYGLWVGIPAGLGLLVLFAARVDRERRRSPRRGGNEPSADTGSG